MDVVRCSDVKAEIGVLSGLDLLLDEIENLNDIRLVPVTRKRSDTHHDIIRTVMSGDRINVKIKGKLHHRKVLVDRMRNQLYVKVVGEKFYLNDMAMGVRILPGGEYEEGLSEIWRYS